MGVETTERHTLMPNLVEQIVWRRLCGSDVVLTLYGDETKYARIAIGKSMSSITLRRYRDVVIINACFILVLYFQPSRTVELWFSVP